MDGSPGRPLRLSHGSILSSATNYCDLRTIVSKHPSTAGPHSTSVWLLAATGLSLRRCIGYYARCISQPGSPPPPPPRHTPIYFPSPLFTTILFPPSRCETEACHDNKLAQCRSLRNQINANIQSNRMTCQAGNDAVCSQRASITKYLDLEGLDSLTLFHPTSHSYPNNDLQLG